ncbi:uncharacterized protein [Setaria viridis]|uniref:uncharacterized protein n=1 Tax=Setaria viridis TaxID=4556 RepID=UPI003B3BDFFE
MWFADYLLRISNSTEETFGSKYVLLPDYISIDSPSEDICIDTVIDRVFPDLPDNRRSASYMCKGAILSTWNEHIDAVNALMIDRFPSTKQVYYSFDSAEDDTRNNYPLDFLNSITLNKLPPHKLTMKKNCPVILLRDLDPYNGFCNGTRLIIKGFQKNSIDAEIVSGQHARKRVFIPRIPMSPPEDLSLPFKFKHKQFPVRLSFTMTINKAQGQTIPNVGIYLPEPVFAHRQLYVALSEGVSCETTWVLARKNKDMDPTRRGTKNIVYRYVLET